ncbi:MAG: arginine--tRNA ligase [Magnetococcus sp. DMHC-6]
MRRMIETLLQRALEQLTQEGVFPAGTLLPFKVERPREKNHGDFSTNAALVLSRWTDLKPRALAEKILLALSLDRSTLADCQIAGPGFINFTLSTTSLLGVITDILQAGTQYGRGSFGRGKRIQIEFVSANPTGPMHVGHGRGAIFGDVLARILEASGYEVLREYYINDAGHQIEVLGNSVLYRYRQKLGLDLSPPEEFYPGEYVGEIAQKLIEQEGGVWLSCHVAPQPVVDFAVATVLAYIRQDLDQLGIRFDSWFSERTLHREGRIEQVLALLTEKGLLYQGILEPPKALSATETEEWEARPQLLFRSTRFGDEVDRPLQKGDGQYTYFAADVAYHFDKAQRGFDRLINVWGADHGGYIKRVQAALAALTGKTDLLEVKLMQMVNLTRGGEPVRMSKRAGNFVTLNEIVEETSADAVRFWFLTRSENSGLDFDLDLAVAKSNDNPVFYVQYAHARICSVGRQLREKGLEEGEEADLSLLQSQAELDLVRLLGSYPEIVENAAKNFEPHRIPYYLIELATAFHTYYNGHRILESDINLRNARLKLISAVRCVLANGLGLLGIQAPESM